jgi:hypothetical protein
VIAVATRDRAGRTTVTPPRSATWSWPGSCRSAIRPRSAAAASLARLRSLGIEVKLLTGDNDRVAVKVCGDLGSPCAQR